MDRHGCRSVDKSKVKRKVRKCRRENSDGNIGDGESTDKEVSEPMSSRKKDKSVYKCSRCFLIYTTVDGLMKHLLTHQKNQVVRFPKTSGILETEKLKANNEKNLPICKVIIIRCDNLYSPYQPIGTVHTLATNIQEGDAIAGKTVPRRDDLEPGNANSLIKPHKCQGCTKSFASRQVLEIHVQTHTGERPYRCQLCSKSFARQGQLKSHLLTHTGERPHRCQLCSKSFAQQGNLNSHIRTHTGERPHQCQLCSKSFGGLGDLKKHIRTHTGERPHRCQFCSKAFSEQGHLKKHIRTHTGERPHQCRLCSKSFGESGTLKIHIRTHTGERPHRCQLCSKSFGQKCDLQRHIRSHTGERPQ